MPRCIALVFWLTLLGSLSLAKPPSAEEGERQKDVLEQLKTSVAAATTDAGKFTAITQVMTKERDVDLRRRVLDVAKGIPGPALETFLTNILTTEEDAGLRSQAATALGQTGSEKCLAVLVKTAASDRTTTMQVGCIVGRSSARRDAIFALAQLAERFPKLADKAATELRALPIVADPKDNEGLSDARRQALYQITRDNSLLQVYFDQLKNADPRARERSVVAFRFLKLKQAPPEVIKALQDGNPDVRSSAAMVLGEIGDPQGAEPLMAAARDTKLDRAVRCNAIAALGRMRFAAAADLMEKLLVDPDGAVSGNAAVALYRMTGKKTKQFPEGYNAD